MDIERIQYNFPSLCFKIHSLPMLPERKYRDIHLHTDIELICADSGSLACSIHDEEVLLQENEALLINPLFHHKLRALEPSSVTYIQIDITKYSIQDFSRVSDNFNTFISHRFLKSYCRISQDSELYRLFMQMKQEAIRQQNGFQLYLKGYIYQTAAYINRHFISPQVIPEKQLSDIIPVVAYIESNCLSRIYLDGIAQATGIEKYRLCKRFKQATGRTIVDYVNFIRLQKALELLAEGNGNISETAFSSGFSSVQYFNRLFKKYYACTPSQYIKSIEKTGA